MKDFNSLVENQDGTLSGGFVSVTGGRYRIIVGAKMKPEHWIKNETCNGKTNRASGDAIGCQNMVCHDNINSGGSCENFTCHATSSPTK